MVAAKLVAVGDAQSQVLARRLELRNGIQPEKGHTRDLAPAPGLLAPSLVAPLSRLAQHPVELARLLFDFVKRTVLQ